MICCIPTLKTLFHSLCGKVLDRVGREERKAKEKEKEKGREKEREREKDRERGSEKERGKKGNGKTECEKEIRERKGGGTLGRKLGRERTKDEQRTC